jgi:hypothetical protein
MCGFVINRVHFTDTSPYSHTVATSSMLAYLPSLITR